MTYLSEAQVLGLVCISRSTLHRHIAAGTFPPPIKPNGRNFAWAQEAITQWQVCRAIEADFKRLGGEHIQSVFNLAAQVKEIEGCWIAFAEVFPGTAAAMGRV